MFGWRARIGMVFPTNTTVVEPEMAYLAPDGVTYHATRVISSRTGCQSIEGLQHAVASVKRAAEELSVPDFSSILYGCMSSSFAVETWDDDFEDLIHEWTPVPAITAFRATCKAVQSFGVKRVAVLCPYGEELQKLAYPSFARYGLEIATIQSLNVVNLRDICNVPETKVYRIAKDMDKKDGDLLCILATDIHTVSIIPELEKDIEMPVISANLALAWASQGLANVREKNPRGGQLFEHRFSG